jgi:hypothetical protein
MPTKLIVTADGPVEVELTQAELDQRAADNAVVQQRRAEKQAEETRLGTLSADSDVKAMALRLATSSNAQIDTYFANNVTNAAQAIGVLKLVVKIIAFMLARTLKGLTG